MSLPSMNDIPLWAVFAIMVATVLASLTIGYRVGMVVRKRVEGEPEGPIGGVVGATLGLLAFMLAFTFGVTTNRFDARKQLLLDEVNALRTAALRADLLPEPHRTECGRLVRLYVDSRLRAVADTANMPAAIKEAERIQSELWSHAVALARADMNSDIGALFVEAINSVVEIHTSRTTVGLQYRIPQIVWSILLLLTVLSMVAVGYQFGIVGRCSAAEVVILALSFSLVVLLIADLDRSTGGLVTVNQQPMIDLQQRLSGNP
ncbi:MAG: hypothetical protein IT577_08155 [Verrucomicrobiae bacterium]|nr:hypothetical protein [Verrucomicrobiae bacterium]